MKLIVWMNSLTYTEMNKPYWTKKDYLEAYGIGEGFYNKISVEKYYEDVAFFFILSEAKRYIAYQLTNGHSRVRICQSGGV